MRCRLEPPSLSGVVKSDTTAGHRSGIDPQAIGDLPVVSGVFSSLFIAVLSFIIYSLNSHNTLG